MKSPADVFPDVFSTEHIVDNYDLCFDPADPRNGSLYVCTPRNGAGAGPQVERLRQAGLWSAETPKTVPDEQRQAYKEGLIFNAARVYGQGDKHWVLARFDHPKFPSNADQWAAWNALFEAERDHVD